MHLFERRAREAGQRDTRPPDIDRDFITIDRAAQIRREIEMENSQVPQVPPPPPREPTAEEARWSVRGEPRTRARFADPHPRDFPGGLPIPPDCPLS